MITATGVPDLSARFSSSVARSSIARRLATPVSASVRASRLICSSSRKARRFDVSSTRPSSWLTTTASARCSATLNDVKRSSDRPTAIAATAVSATAFSVSRSIRSTAM